MDQWYLVGEFGRRAGVTVRALHHYDRLGLLRPARRGSGGYRAYNDADLMRLQQIVTLKELDFDLDAIAVIIDDPKFDLATALRAQIELLEKRQRKLKIAIQAMRDAERRANEAGSLRWETLVPIIKATIAMHDIDFKKYFTGEQLENLGARNFTPEDQTKISELWNHLFADIDTARNEDPSSPAARALLERWESLVSAFTQADPGLQHGLNELYADPENRAAATRANPTLPDAWAFIERVRAARRTQ